MKAFLKKYSAQLTLLLFGLIYCSISLYNHYNFRTFSYDLGLVNNAIYDYAHLRWNDCMLMQLPFKNVLEDHFTLLQVLFSPLYYVFGTYTMLVVQIACILTGAFGIYKLFFDDNSPEFALIAMIHFLTAFGIFSALAFDYHDNVAGTMAVPWLFYFFKKEKWVPSAFMVAIILISKENMALWMGFIALGMVLDNFRNKKKRTIAGAYMLLSLVYFYLVIHFIMPSLAIEQRGYLHFQYEVLGKGFKEAFLFMLHNPLRTLQLLFVNHLPDPAFDKVKMELHFMVLICGGYCFLLRPQYLVMLIPIYGQKLFSDDIIKWGINNHYSVEFAPILTIALFTVLSTVTVPKLKGWLTMAAAVVSVYFSIHKIDRRISPWYDGMMLRFYSPHHYRNNFDVALAHQVLKSLIPDKAIVSAHQQVVPHLAFRDYIYMFPEVRDAEYIVLLDKQNPYPISTEELTRREAELRASHEWTIIYDYNNMLIIRKNK